MALCLPGRKNTKPTIKQAGGRRTDASHSRPCRIVPTTIAASAYIANFHRVPSFLALYPYHLTMATTDSATSPPVTPSVLLPPPIPPTSAPKAASSPVPPGPIVLNKHATSIAAQSDVAKYRGKYKELKSKNREIELVSCAIQQ